jgi:hypothetical protein
MRKGEIVKAWEQVHCRQSIVKGQPSSQTHVNTNTYKI